MSNASNAKIALKQYNILIPERKMAQSLLYLARRVGFLILYVATFATFGLVLYLVAPLTSACFFNDWRFWRHIHKFHRLVYRMFTHTISLITQPSYAQAFHLPWMDAPRDAPDLSRVAVSESWKAAHGESCDGCVACCERIGCNLIDREAGGCMVYGSFFWRYFTCGRFPANQMQIDFYQCKKWVVKH